MVALVRRSENRYFIDEAGARFEVLHDAAICPKRLLKEALPTGGSKNDGVGAQSVGLADRKFGFNNTPKRSGRPPTTLFG